MVIQDEWFTGKLSNLQQEELRISTLSELRDHLKALPHEEAASISSSLQLPLVFDCLNDSNSEQVDLACEVLTLCLNNLHLGESTERYRTALERSLMHPYPVVKSMALNEIGRSITNEELLCSLCDQSTLILNIVQCVGDVDLGVAKRAGQLLETLGASVPGANRMVSNEVLMALEQLLSLNEMVRLRVYELIITISKHSQYGFSQFEAVGLIRRVVEEIDNNDVLLKLNVVQILSELALSEHGYLYLDEQGVFQRIYALISEDELTTQLCQPGILKFFGQIGHKKPRELLAKYPTLFDHLFGNIEQSDLIIIGISLDTIGFIGQTSQGKLALDSTGSKMEGTIRTISKLLPSLPTETRVRALHCLENLLRDGRYDTMQIAEKWYRLLGSEPMELVAKYAKNPFADLRLAGLGVLNAIAGQPWGQEAIKNSPGLVEFLLDRSAESIKDCKQAKYDIVKLFSQSVILDRNMQERVDEYVKQGPFYVQAVTEVAVEGN